MSSPEISSSRGKGRIINYSNSSRFAGRNVDPSKPLNDNNSSLYLLF